MKQIDIDDEELQIEDEASLPAELKNSEIACGSIGGVFFNTKKFITALLIFLILIPFYPRLMYGRYIENRTEEDFTHGMVIGLYSIALLLSLIILIVFREPIILSITISLYISLCILEIYFNLYDGKERYPVMVIFTDDYVVKLKKDEILGQEYDMERIIKSRDIEEFDVKNENVRIISEDDEIKLDCSDKVIMRLHSYIHKI